MNKALLIIDWEKEWIDQESEYYVGSNLKSTTGLVNKLIQFARSKGYKVIFVIIIKEIYDINTNLCDFLKKNPFVISVYHTTGVCNYILKVATPDIKTMHGFIFDLQQLAKIETSIILDKVVEKNLELRLNNK